MSFEEELLIHAQKLGESVTAENLKYFSELSDEHLRGRLSTVKCFFKKHSNTIFSRWVELSHHYGDPISIKESSEGLRAC